MPALKCDVLVVGSGIAGLTGALAAAEAGLAVIVCEKTPKIGGTSAYSEAMIWAPLSAQARAAGVPDRFEDALAYAAAAAGPSHDEALAGAYLRAIPQALAFIEAHGGVRYTLTRGSFDYLSDLTGATLGARALTPEPFDGRGLGRTFARLRGPLPTTQILGGMSVASGDLVHFLNVGRTGPATWSAAQLVARYLWDRIAGFPRGARLTGGDGVVAALLLAASRRGVQLLTDMPLTGLERRDGRVVGATLGEGEGSRPVAVQRGVLLAAGGFAGARPMTAPYLPHVARGRPHWSLAPATNAGDTARIAAGIGAVLRENLSQPVAWAPVSLVPNTSGGIVGFPHFIDRQKPGMICVDRRGRRFANEAESYHAFVPQMLRATERDPDDSVLLVCDRVAQRRYGLGAAPPSPGRLGRHLANGYLLEAPTLRALAERAGIEPAGLEGTVLAFNEHAREGRDPHFGRGSTAYQRANGDPSHVPNPCLGPLEVPPFYAVRLWPGDLGSFVGLRVDANARVLDASGRSIPGLYAAGSDMANPFGGAYPGAGVGVGSAVAFGWLAGRHMAGAEQTAAAA